MHAEPQRAAADAAPCCRRSEHSVVSRSAFDASRTRLAERRLREGARPPRPSEVARNTRPARGRRPRTRAGPRRGAKRRMHSTTCCGLEVALARSGRGSARTDERPATIRSAPPRRSQTAVRTLASRSCDEASARRPLRQLDERRHAAVRPSWRARSSSGATSRNAAATARKSPPRHSDRRASRSAPPRAARRAARPAVRRGGATTAASAQPSSSSAASEAPAFQSASTALRSVRICSAMSVAARRRVSMSPPTKRRLVLHHDEPPPQLVVRPRSARPGGGAARPRREAARRGTDGSAAASMSASALALPPGRPRTAARAGAAACRRRPPGCAIASRAIVGVVDGARLAEQLAPACPTSVAAARARRAPGRSRRSSTAAARRSAMICRCAASSFERSSSRDWACVTATAARSREAPSRSRRPRR